MGRCWVLRVHPQEKQLIRSSKLGAWPEGRSRELLCSRSRGCTSVGGLEGTCIPLFSVLTRTSGLEFPSMVCLL